MHVVVSLVFVQYYHFALVFFFFWKTHSESLMIVSLKAIS